MPRLRGRRASIVGAVLVVALIAAAVGVSRTPLFAARELQVQGGPHLSRAQIVELAGISRATNVIWLDETAVERRLEANAWVARADVSGEFPATLRITVSERSPVATMSDGVQAWLMAGDGTILGAATPRADGLQGRELPRIRLSNSPAVEGARPDPAGAGRVLAAMRPRLRDRVGRVLVRLDGTLELRLEEGPVVQFGAPSEAAVKVRTIARLLAWADANGERIVRLTVTSPRAPAAVFATPSS